MDTDLGRAPETIRQRIANLSPEQRAVLERLLGSNAAAMSRLATTPRNSASEPVPLSYAQQGLWLIDQMETGSRAYVVAAAQHVAGPLDVRLLERGLNEVIRRHDSLRTTFAVVEGQPIQVVAPTLTLTLPVMDLRHLPRTASAAEAARQLQTEAQRPFDLGEGPLVRAVLFQLADEDFDFLITVHHSVADGWSMGLLLRELAALYAAFAAGQPSPLSALPIQYADYAAWQRERLGGETLERQLAYWKGLLSGAPQTLELPTDHPRPNVASGQGRNAYFALPADLMEELRQLSRREGATLFMTLLAAFLTLLSRSCRQQDLVVGTPIATRNRSDLEGLIGHFVNTLVLRVDLAGNPTFRELLGRVRETTLGAFAHQDLPFEKLVEALQPPRVPGRNPLFQVLFALLNSTMTELELPGLRLERLNVETDTAKFDLYVELEETSHGLRGRLEYSTDLFEAGTVARMAEHYRMLVEGVVADPGRKLSDLPLLPEEERWQVLAGWNQTRRDVPRDANVPDLFAAQAQRTPDAVAVVCEGESLSYRELDARANQVANHLRALGVGPDVLVGLCVERSLEMIVGLLGILKAGGAYLPLDPSYPRERLAFMLADARPAVLLTQRARRESLAARGARTLCLDDDWAVLAPDGGRPLAQQAGADHLAYVIYTSGSTGQPKGVQVRRGAVTNFLRAMADLLQLTAADRLLAVTSLSFDIAVLELFLPLIVGARVELASRAEVTDAVRLRERIERGGITVLQATPTTWQMLVAAGWQGSGLLTALCGGEALPPDLARQVLTRGARLWNLFGPTETTVWSTAQPVASADECVPIGRPIANTCVYVLDDQLQPVPVGVPGELYIGGAGLARGYLGRPDLTAEKFVPDPFSGEPGARLYRTGDLSRWRADGTLEFLGRLDQQVKLRGFRIELGEIEIALRSHPGVREAAVTLHADRPGDGRLVAYLVPRDGASPTADELRRHLAVRLPDYMLPAAFVRLDALPMTPSGKLDRHALPAPTIERSLAGKAYAAPRSTVERLVATTWRNVLHVERVGLNDNFFDLGGSSLQLLHVRSTLQDALRRDVPMPVLFRYPTVDALTRYLASPASEPSAAQRLQEQARKQVEASVHDRQSTSRNGA